MKNKKLNSLTITVLCLGLIALVLPVAVNAQGRYTGKYSKQDVSNIIAKLESSSNTFSRDFDRSLDNSSLDGTNEEDRLNAIVRGYENDLDNLRRDYDRWDSWWQSRRNVQNVMSSARNVNGMMNTLPFAKKLEKQWKNMRKDLNKLADTYDLPPLDNSSGGGSVPSWAVGTFYGKNPQTGGTIILTIYGNGNVSADFQGSSTSGSYYNESINIDGAVARVRRIDNGISTTRTDNGERIDYFRNNSWGNNGNENSGDVPNWALGTFYARNPQTGGTIRLTIESNGNVTVDFQGSITYGTIYKDRLTINGATAKVRKINNGIRTTREDNGERIDYFRQLF